MTDVRKRRPILGGRARACSSGAMRAAESILGFDYVPSETEIAAIIDESTQLPQILEVLEQVCSAFIKAENYPEFGTNKDHFIDLADIETKARAILTALKSQDPTL